MSEHGKVSWGKIIKGALLVTAVVAACVFVPQIGPAIGSATEIIGSAIAGIGSGITSAGAWIASHVATIAAAGATSQATTLATAAVVGGTGMALATQFTDRINNAAESVGVETGRKR